MSLAAYTNQYREFISRMAQTRLVALTAADHLSELPKGLPASLAPELRAVATAIEEALDGGQGVRQIPGVSSPYLLPTLAFFVSRLENSAGKVTAESVPTDASHVAYSQELILHVASVEAFLADTVRIICVTQPLQLARDKKIAWHDVVKAGSWPAVVELLIDEYLMELGMQSLVGIVSLLQERFGLSLPTDARLLDVLAEAEERRHLIMHNGARVNRRYLHRFPSDALGLGDRLPMTRDYTESVFKAGLTLGGDLYRTAAKKFLRASPADLIATFGSEQPHSLGDA